MSPGQLAEIRPAGGPIVVILDPVGGGAVHDELHRMPGHQCVRPAHVIEVEMGAYQTIERDGASRDVA